jgi:large subunit ribosomal protein L7/L12
MSRPTVVWALELLKRDGWLESRQGFGTTVRWTATASWSSVTGAAGSAPEKLWLLPTVAHTLPLAEAGSGMSDEKSTEYYTLLCDDPLHEVVLIDCGSRELDVIRAVGKVTGLSLWHSRVLARQAPVVLVGGLSAYGAQSAVALLQSAGARAEWRQEPESGERTAPSP